MPDIFYELVNTGNVVKRKVGNVNDLLFIVFKTLVMIEVTISLGVFFNRIFPSYRSDEDLMTTHIYFLTQSISILFQFMYLFYMQKFIMNITNYNHNISSMVFFIINIILITILIQTQRNYYKRVKVITKNEYSFILNILSMC